MLESPISNEDIPEEEITPATNSVLRKKVPYTWKVAHEQVVAPQFAKQYYQPPVSSIDAYPSSFFKNKVPPPIYATPVSCMNLFSHNDATAGQYPLSTANHRTAQAAPGAGGPNTFSYHHNFLKRSSS